MRIGIQLNGREFGGRETHSFVASIRPESSEIRVDFIYQDEDSDQDSGSIALTPAEARQLGAALIAVAEGYTGGKEASFTSEVSKIIHAAVGK